MAGAATEALAFPPHGGMFYQDFIIGLLGEVRARSYLEVGVAQGDLLRRVECPAIAVDPRIIFQGNVVGKKPFLLTFQMTSDEFFNRHDPRRFFPEGIDVTFLDGLHQFEYLLRDFIKAERACHPRSVILLHDCLPMNEEVAERVPDLANRKIEATRSAWTGDVWKVVPILRRMRPSLRITLLDCPPTGLVMVSNLDPASSVLEERYFDIVDEWLNKPLSAQTWAETLAAGHRPSSRDMFSRFRLSLHARL